MWTLRPRLLLAPMLLLVTIVPASAWADPPSPTTAAGCAADKHQLRVVNKCDHAVWLAELGSSSVKCNSSSPCTNPLEYCNEPKCSSDTQCPAIACSSPSDCPGASPNCVNNFCTPTCDTGSGLCLCTNTGPACPGGGTCNITSGSFGECAGGFCTFSTIPPNPSSPNSWKLDKSGGSGRQSLSLCMPQGWGGRFWGRTSCTQSTPGAADLSCTTGQCGVPGVAECSTSSIDPATLFEFQFDAGSTIITDYYDSSLVSGYNIPLQMQTKVSSSCAVAACSNNVNARCPKTLRIIDGTCTSDSDCSGGGACVDQQCVVGCSDPCDLCEGPNPPARLKCSKFMDQYCCLGTTSDSCNSASATCFDDDDCQNLANGTLTGTCDQTTHLCTAPCTSNADCNGNNCNTALGQCDPPVIACGVGNTCAAGTCDTQLFGGQGACVPASNCCGPYNPRWLRAAKQASGGRGKRPWTKIFKGQCGSAYSFQYDDPSSLFTCNDNGGQENDYVVTFCP